LTVYYGAHKGPPLFIILSKMNPVHNFPTSFSKIYSNIFRLHLDLTSGLFPSYFPIMIVYSFLTFPMRSTRPAHLMLFDVVKISIYEVFHYGIFFYIFPPLPPA